MLTATVGMFYKKRYEAPDIMRQCKKMMVIFQVLFFTLQIREFSALSQYIDYLQFVASNPGVDVV